MATQNPIESEGTYPLPEAQVDRFLMKVVVGYPTPAEEATVVERSLRPAAEVRPVLDAAGLAPAPGRDPGHLRGPGDRRLRGRDRGCDPRARPLRPGRTSPSTSGSAPAPAARSASIHAARALALIRGRRYVIPQDVAELARDVLRHRIVPSFTALAEEVTPDRMLDSILPAVPAPRLITAEERSA